MEAKWFGRRYRRGAIQQQIRESFGLFAVFCDLRIRDVHWLCQKLYYGFAAQTGVRLSENAMLWKLSRWICVCFLLSILLPSLSGAETVYKFGVVPQFEPRKLAAIWSPILTELEKRTGFKLEMVGAPRIPEFESEFQVGRYDFAYMNPYHAVVAQSKQKYEPLVRDGAEKLFGVLVVAKDGPIQDVFALSGKTVAFPAPNSFGASLLMRAELDRRRIKFQPLWSQTHTSAYLNVALGKADAAGGIMATLKQQPQSVQDKLQIVFESTRAEPHPVMVHPRVPAADREKLRQAFIDMGSTPEGAAMLALVPMRQPVSASFEDYKPLLRLGLEKYYIKGGE